MATATSGSSGDDAHERPLVTSSIEPNFLRKKYPDTSAQPQDQNDLLFTSGSIFVSFISVAIPYSIALLTDGALGLLEYTGIMSFGQSHGAYALATYLPFIHVLFRAVGFALATGATNVITYNFLRESLESAQTAFRLFIYCVLGWAALMGAIVAPLSRIISTGLDGGLQSSSGNHVYILSMALFDTLTALFSLFSLSILAVEGRTLLNVSRHIFVTSFSVVLQTSSYFYIQAYNRNQRLLFDTHVILEEKDMGFIPPLMGASLGPLISQFLVTVWIIFLLTDVTFFGIPHTGTLRLCAGRRKLMRNVKTKTEDQESADDRVIESKPRALRILTKITLFFPQNYLTHSYVPGVVLFINCITNVVYDRENYRRILTNRLSNLIFLRCYALFSAVPSAIALAFRTISIHTLRKKAYARAKSLFGICLLSSIIVPPIICLMGILGSDTIISVFTPKAKALWNEDVAESMQDMLPIMKGACRNAALSPLLMGPYHLIVTIHEIEGKWIPTLFFALGRCVIANIGILCYALILGDSVDFFLAIFFGDMFASIVGLLYSVYYWNKCKHLAVVEQLRFQLSKSVENEQLYEEDNHSNDERTSLPLEYVQSQYLNAGQSSVFDTNDNATGHESSMDF